MPNVPANDLFCFPCETIFHIQLHLTPPLDTTLPRFQKRGISKDMSRNLIYSLCFFRLSCPLGFHQKWSTIQNTGQKEGLDFTLFPKVRSVSKSINKDSLRIIRMVFIFLGSMYVEQRPHVLYCCDHNEHLFHVTTAIPTSTYRFYHVAQSNRSVSCSRYSSLFILHFSWKGLP